MGIEWKNPGAKLPVGLYPRLSERAKNLRGGKTGLGQYVWAVAVYYALTLSDDALAQAARALRNHFDESDDLNVAGEIVVEQLRLAENAHNALHDAEHTLVGPESEPTPKQQEGDQEADDPRSE